MKKIFFGILAVVAMIATSCQQEVDLGVEAGKTATVSFEVGTPTRAYSDGTTATVLQYAVYEGETELTDLTVTDGEIHGSTTVNLQLVTGNTYTVIFWAAAPSAPYTVDFGAKSMTVDYTSAVSNDETRDAFYAKHTFTVHGAQTETIILKRPFAQLNIGTSDYAASTSAGYTPKYSKVTVKNIYDTLNLWDGSVANDQEVVYDWAEIKKNEVFPVAGHEYLAMNYLLVNAQEPITVVFEYSENYDVAEKERTVGSVPVQRNYRTNLYGQLLTSNVGINVTIDPIYEEPAHEVAALHKAALNGGEITLTEDVVLTAPLEVYADMTINLNGKTISGNIHKSVGHIIKNNGTLTIVGGTISSLAKNGGSAIANYGTLTVENATLNGAEREGDSWPSYPVNNYGNLTLTNTTVNGHQGCVALNAAGTTVLNNCVLTKNYMKTSSHAFYVNHADAKVIVNGGTYNHNGFDGSLAYVNKGEVIINDGTFSAKDGGYGFAVLSAGKVTINGGNINAGLLNWGGQFVINGGVYTAQPKADYLAEGLKTIKKDNKWHVVAEEVEVVAETVAELSEALTNGEDVALAGDIAVAASEAVSNGYGACGISQLNGGVIDGQGNDVSVNKWGTWDTAINTTGGTIKNVNVTGGMRGIFINHNSTNCSKVILDNVVIDGTIYTISCDQGTNKGLEAYNSTFNGWTSYAATLGETKFVGCSFGEGQGYAFCRPYAATEFVNCAFAAGYELDACAAVTFENCTLGGVALTADNIATLVVDGVANVTVK